MAHRKGTKLMKRYIILGYFFNMGGGPLYTRNKVEYLKKNGWKVEVYTGKTGKLLLDDMKEFENNYFPELGYFPFYIKRKNRKRIIEAIVGNTKYEETIIESSNLPYGLWGELIAEKIGAKHVMFYLDEQYSDYAPWIYKYLDFKHNRKELAGIVAGSMQRMFKQYKNISDKEDYHLRFCSVNQISDKNNPVIETIQRGDINLGCISRLDKDYIIPMVKEICKFAEGMPEKRIVFILVGDASDKNILKEIEKIVESVSNLELYALGALSPLPHNLIDFVDYFIGTAGSTKVTAQEQKITIYLDTVDAYPVGIRGYDTEGGIFAAKKEENRTLSVYLSDLVKDEERQVKIKNCLEIYATENRTDFMKEFDKHMEFIQSSANSQIYYSFKKFGWKAWLKICCCQILGIKKISEIKRV